MGILLLVRRFVSSLNKSPSGVKDSSRIIVIDEICLG